MELSLDNVERVVIERIAPILAVDKGLIRVVDVQEALGVIRVALGGSYRGCPSGSVVFEHVVEPTLRHVLSGVQKVELTAWVG